MTLRFFPLGSGSSGNACYLEVDGFGILIDIGLGVRRLTRDLELHGISWGNVKAVLLTHTHSDHWQHAMLKTLHRFGIPLYCHADHAAALFHATELFGDLEDAELARRYVIDAALQLGPIHCRPFAVPHDDEPTCGFRFEGVGWAVGYAADLGSWSGDIVHQLSDVDILALEFNHDVHLQKTSGRHPDLIRRVLGKHGHLSNEQAAELLQAVLKRSKVGRLQHVVQLHLSQQCNTLELAQAAASRVLVETTHEVEVRTALPAAMASLIEWNGVGVVQRMLPGWDDFS